MRIIRLNKEAVGSPKTASIPAPWKGDGFAVEFGGQRLYVWEVAQEGSAQVRLHARGIVRHGAIPQHQTNAIVRLTRPIRRITRRPSSLHMMSAARQFLAAVAAVVGRKHY